MPDDVLTQNGAISVDKVCQALNRVIFETPQRQEVPPAQCAWPRLCGKGSCRFPRYFDTEPRGVVGKTLIRLGFPSTVLKELDTEYKVGEVLHPGVEIDRSRNQALTRIDPRGIALLAWFQDQAKHRLTWSQLHVRAFKPRKGLKYFDRKARPWLY